MTKPHTHKHTQRCRWKRKEKFPCDNNTSCSQESEFINHLSCSRQQLWSFHLWPLRQTTSTKSCFCFYVLALYAIQCVLIWEGEGARGCLFLIPRSTLSHKDGVIYVSPVFFFFYDHTYVLYSWDSTFCSEHSTLISGMWCWPWDVPTNPLYMFLSVEEFTQFVNGPNSNVSISTLTRH